ncbi:MAG: DICT sensory domain-containing protein [Synechococcales bacterium]|nr:DICT sensory domain-containing protein [Synechococcales bacterium]
MLEGSILKQLKDAHRQEGNGKRPLNFGVYYKNTLVALCHALEDSILTANYEPLVITAFQRGKWYLQEADRYHELAQNSRDVIIMAAPDAGFQDHPTSRLANVRLVSLTPSDPVAQEWHLIILSPRYTAMVLCQELSDEDYGQFGRPKTDLERKFYGFWTFEPNLVQETAELAIAHLQQYEPALGDRLRQQVQDMASTAPSQDHSNLSPVENVSTIVQRVVDDLQTSQDESSTTPQVSFAGDDAFSRLDMNLVSNKLQAYLRLSQLLDQADVSNPMAATEVAALAEAIGQLLDLPGWQLHRLRLAGLLHRLAFLQGAEVVLSPSASPRYPDADAAVPPSCPLNMGTQALRLMPRLRAIATIITHQSEWWNGSGQPARLAHDEIPLESRILGLAAEFQHRLAAHQPEAEAGDRFNSHLNPDKLDLALADCAQQAGERWDPKLMEVLALLVSGLKQGLSLSVASPKIAAGLWLLDAETETPLFALTQ